MQKNFKGFTLVELVITIVIIVVLSSISAPIYRSYAKNAIETEGYLLLHSIRDAQNRYRIKTGAFRSYTWSGGYLDGNKTSYDPLLEIDARANKYFTCFSLASDQGANVQYYARVYSSNRTMFLNYNLNNVKIAQVS